MKTVLLPLNTVIGRELRCFRQHRGRLSHMGRRQAELLRRCLECWAAEPGGGALADDSVFAKLADFVESQSNMTVILYSRMHRRSSWLDSTVFIELTSVSCESSMCHNHHIRACRVLGGGFSLPLFPCVILPKYIKAVVRAVWVGSYHSSFCFCGRV